MSRFLSGDSTVPAVECHATAGFLAPFWGCGISPTSIQKRFSGVRCLSFRILPIVWYSGQARWSTEKLVNWVFSDAQITGTIVTPAGSWSCVSHHGSPVFFLLYVQRLNESARRTSSKLRCAWNGRCAKSNWIHLKISLWYNVLKIGEWSSIKISAPSPKSLCVRCFHRASAHWDDSIVKWSSPCLTCWSIHIVVCWLNDLACLKPYDEWNGCHGFHWSEYLRCLLYNQVALPYAYPPALSTPTTCLWALVFIGSGVHVRSRFWGSIVSSSGVSSGNGAPGSVVYG